MHDRPPAPSPASAALQLVLGRCSASPKRLVLPGPSPADLDVIVRAACSAPDHKSLRPYRFILIPEEKRADLAAAFREAKRERDPAVSDEELVRAGEKAFRGPVLLAVVTRVERDHPRVSSTDQLLTVGAAVQCMLLAANALGFGACIRSGTSATSRKVRQALGLAAHEELAGFVMFGTNSGPPRSTARSTDGVLTRW